MRSTFRDDDLRALRDIGISRLCVSLHATDRRLHNRIMGADAYDRAVALLEKARSMGIQTAISSCLMAVNFEEVPKVIRFAAEAGVAYHSTSLYVATGRGDLGLDIAPDQYREFLEYWRDERRQLEGRVTLGTHHETLYCLVDPEYAKNPMVVGCTAGWSTLRLTETGDVTPCNLMPTVAGNVREQPVAEIWRSSPVMLRLRDRDALQGRCGACEYRYVCGGCRSTALAYTGDLMGEDPRCWYTPPGCRSRAAAAAREAPD